MYILKHPTEWLIPDQAVQLASKGLKEATQYVIEGNHAGAAEAFSNVAVGLIWQAMHQRALANAQVEDE